MQDEDGLLKPARDTDIPNLVFISPSLNPDADAGQVEAEVCFTNESVKDKQR